MTSPIDKLFRDKLEPMNKPAPAAAWDRIENELNKTQTKGLWMKIAAGLALLAVAAFLLWPSKPVTDSTLSSVKSNPSLTVQPKVEEPGLDEPVQQKPLAAEESKKDEHVRGNTVPVNLKQKQEPVLLTVVEPESSERVELVTEHPAAIVSIPEELPTLIEKPASTKITYSAEEVNARFLKKQAPADATPEEKKPSGIQKLMGLAYNLKNSDTGLGDLRQKKDEILALNFRDKKEEAQN